MSPGVGVIVDHPADVIDLPVVDLILLRVALAEIIHPAKMIAVSAITTDVTVTVLVALMIEIGR